MSLSPEVIEKLRAPLDASAIGWKPQVFSKDKSSAMMVAFIDARVVAERLDDATGGDWSFLWDELGDGSGRVVVKGTLTVCGQTRQDVGEYDRNDDRDRIDPYKAAVSDALKRAAVLFGVGREVYRLPQVWVDWDQRRRAPLAGQDRKLKDALAGREVESVEPEASRKPAPRKVAAYGGGKRDVPHWTRDPEAGARFKAWRENLQLTQEDIKTALGIESLSDFTGGQDDAMRQVREWMAKESAGEVVAE